MAQIKADEISQILREQIANYDSKVRVDEVGTIISLGDGIARIHGLDKVMAGELLAFPHGIAGLAMSLEEDQVGAVLLGRGQRGQAHRQDPERARRGSDDWPRRQRARRTHRRQGSDRHHGHPPRGADRSRHRRSPEPQSSFHPDQCQSA